MDQLFAAFGIDWRLLLINAINYGILLGGLWYFLYKPVTNMLEARRAKVAQGVADAEEANRQLMGIEEAREARLADAGREADELLAASRDSAGVKAKEIMAQAQAAAARAVDEANKQSAELKAKAFAESKEEVARLIELGIDK